MTGEVPGGALPRPWWQIIGIGLVFAAWLLLATFYNELRFGSAALPVRIAVECEGGREAGDLKLAWQFRRGDWASPIRGYTRDHATVWRIHGAWIASLMLAGTPAALDQIKTVNVEIGHGKGRVVGGTWPSQWPPRADDPTLELSAGWEFRQLTVKSRRADSVWPSFARLLNYPGDVALLRRAVMRRDLIAFLGCALVVFAARCWLLNRVGSGAFLDAVVPHCQVSGVEPQLEGLDTNGRTRTLGWLLTGLAFLIGCGVFLQTQNS